MPRGATALAVLAAAAAIGFGTQQLVSQSSKDPARQEQIAPTVREPSEAQPLQPLIEPADNQTVAGAPAACHLEGLRLRRGEGAG